VVVASSTTTTEWLKTTTPPPRGGGVKMANVFERVRDKLFASRYILLVFLAAFCAVVIGCIHFREDTLSSFDGIHSLETAFGLSPARDDLTYWSMALAPQIGQFLFMYLYLQDTQENKWALYPAILFFAVDFIADVQFRSTGRLFPTDGTTFAQHLGAVLLSAALTFGYFTVGSELFISTGIGLLLSLAAPAWAQFRSIKYEMQEQYNRTVLEIDRQQEAVNESVNTAARAARQHNRGRN
jgi:hypothetical protein